eukprot:GEMP01125836.1.p2 GENE.GEMP01125836.1~~GEMP01125836.1.p2  ORF type:complete len:120 (+),score=9.20 GEMP01125836.1:204-563(+)
MRISSNSIARDMNDGSGSLGDQTPISTMGGGARTSKDLRASGSRGSAKGITPSSKQSAKASMKKALLLSKLATSAGSKIPEGGKKPNFSWIIVVFLLLCVTCFMKTDELRFRHAGARLR